MRPDPIALPKGAPKASRPYFARASGRGFQARTDANGATIIDFFDEVGSFGISAAELQARLRDIEGDVVVRLNSPGGDLLDGLAMFNALATHPAHVRVEVVGVAASAASLLAMAADDLAMAENAFLMVHRSWSVTIGNEADHDETSALLRQVDASMAATYSKRSGQAVARINDMMQAETWMNAEESIALGFADEMLEPAAIRAHFDLSVYAKAPAELAAPKKGDIQSIRDLEAILRDAGASRSHAKALAARGFTGDAEQLREAAEIAELAAHISAAAQTLFPTGLKND